jgi:hypothetical protein
MTPGEDKNEDKRRIYIPELRWLRFTPEVYLNILGKCYMYLYRQEYKKMALSSFPVTK